MGVEHGQWLVVGGHYHDKVVSSSGQGKCAFDIEKSLHIRDLSQKNRRKGTSLTSGGSYWDSSTWTYLEFEPKHLEDNCETSNAERRVAKHTKWTFTVIISKRFLFFVVLELQWSLRLICYIFNPLNTEFRSRKKTHFLSNISFLDGFSVSTVISMEMAKNEIFSYCLFCFWNGNCWLCWDLFINGLSFGYFRIWIWGTWTPGLLFWNAW